ncbi:MAG TPA: FGGY family carbohydrate kinase [Acidimicrobiales bacterium]|nr:FGGY family carbohydrate kinase [Acidimicrobiales bacterium]
MILTIDAGTSVTKVALWDRQGLVALAGTPVDTRHPAPGRSEQDPSDWWASVVAGCAQVRRQSPGGFGSVEVVGCTGARQTFALVDASGQALGPGILWSDRRATAEAEQLALGPDTANASAPSGVPLDAGSVAAKIAWLAGHDPRRLEASAWLLAPRDLIAWQLTGSVATDATLASRTGLYDVDGRVVEELAGVAATRLPPVVPSDQVTGHVEASPGVALGLAAGTPVVIGAGDRACEVLGSGSSEARPMVSWGTTANVSVPVGTRPPQLPPGVVLSRGARGGWLLEGGLSAAGSLLAWLGGVTGHTPVELAALALESPPGSRGVVATPWLEGARAPWWQPEAGAAFVGLGSAHGLADIARSAFESVAWEVVRCLEAIGSRQPAGCPVAGLALAGSGASIPVWLDVLTGITGLTATGRRSGQAASAGAAQLAAAAVGMDVDPELIDPVDLRVGPTADTAGRYAELRDHAERVAVAVVDLAGAPTWRPADRSEDLPCG